MIKEKGPSFFFLGQTSSLQHQLEDLGVGRLFSLFFVLLTLLHRAGFCASETSRKMSWTGEWSYGPDGTGDAMIERPTCGCPSPEEGLGDGGPLLCSWIPNCEPVCTAEWQNKMDCGADSLFPCNECLVCMDRRREEQETEDEDEDVDADCAVWMCKHLTEEETSRERERFEHACSKWEDQGLVFQVVRRGLCFALYGLVQDRLRRGGIRQFEREWCSREQRFEYAREGEARREFFLRKLREYDMDLNEEEKRLLQKREEMRRGTEW